jgi:hypothetical protein
MRRLLARTAALTALLVLFMAAARLIGELVETPPPAWLKVEIGQDQQACWHNICPGKTTLEEAERLLRLDNTLLDFRRGALSLCWSAPSSYFIGCVLHNATRDDSPHAADTVNEIMFDNLRGVSLGEMLMAFGEPLGAVGCIRLDEMGQWRLGEAGFKGNIRIRLDPSPSSLAQDHYTVRFRPDITVDHIWIHSAESQIQDRPISAWKGFTAGRCPPK